MQTANEFAAERYDMVDDVKLASFTRQLCGFDVLRRNQYATRPFRRVPLLALSASLSTQSATVNNRGASLLNNKERAIGPAHREGKSKLLSRRLRLRAAT